MYSESFQVATPSDREIEIIRDFHAPREVTKIRITIRYESKEARDMARRSGMEHGMAAGYSRLEELLLSAQERVK